MGTRRLVTFWLSICLLVGTGCVFNFSVCGAQQVSRQAAFNSSDLRGGDFAQPDVPDWMKPGKAVHQSFQQKAKELLAEQEAADRFARQQQTSQPSPQPKHLRSIGFRKVKAQSIPLVENQIKDNEALREKANASNASNGFNPFANHPEADPALTPAAKSQIQKPIKSSESGGGKAVSPTQLPQSKAVGRPGPPLELGNSDLIQEKDKPQAIRPQDLITDPFADPPQEGDSPVPSAREGRVEEQSIKPEFGTTKATGQQVQTPSPVGVSPKASWLPDVEVEYDPSEPYSEERDVPPVGVYTPPIVQPDSGINSGYELQTLPQLYQPAYQPIPGKSSGYPAQSYSPRQTGRSVTIPPVDSSPVVILGPAIEPPVSADVYSPAVGTEKRQAYGDGYSNGWVDDANANVSNFFFSSFVGWAGLQDLPSQSGLGKFQAESGTGFGFALGRRNGHNLRTELEFSSRNNDVTGFDDGVIVSPLIGELKSYSGMANAYWEFVDVSWGDLKPYIGCGIGFISIDSEIGTSPLGSILVPGRDNDTSFAFQYMLGINYRAFANVDLFAEYRWANADTLQIDTVTGISDRYDYHTENVFMGLRWKF